ncbi:MAG: aldo/keto reductase [Lachnospiraceae bacterium]|nr:aldo/keto reductase [Lachnospiraceae bacterium]
MGEKYFAEVKKNFGFGCMRLPMGVGVNKKEFSKMVDYFIDHGFNYFDTAHGYLAGLSEKAIRDCLVKRYDRSEYTLTDKLTGTYFKKQEDIRPFFEKQLKACGVDYFDFYLMHAQDKNIYKKFKACNAYEEALKFKDEGLIKHFGISFHDKAEVLDEILSDYPQIEVVQIQFNYLDYENPSVESRKVYEVCEKYNKPVIVMEPVKGGSLVNLPDDAKKILDEENAKSSTDYSYASYAIRFAASFPNMFMVLSGMSNMEQMVDNVSFMEDFEPLNDSEKKAVENVCKVFDDLQMIACTSCHYCVLDNDCPKNIQIPELFACYNDKKMFKDWNQNMYYGLMTKDHGKASDCIGCGKCEQVCPQHLPIRDLLKDVSRTFHG